MAGSPVCLFRLDEDGHFVWFENPQSVWASADCVGDHFSRLFEDAETAIIRDAIEQAQASGEAATVEVRTSNQLGREHSDRLIRLTVHPGGDDGGCLGSAVDITQERGYMDMQRVLMMEVAHRSKNMLSMILSLAAQTARSTSDTSDFMRRFTGRVQSLARSQDAVTAADWTGVKWRDLVETQVRNVLPGGMADPVISGDDILLSPNASSHVGLALYELVTWSMSNGALCSDGGTLEVSLHVDEDDRGAPAIMYWRDLGNPELATAEPQDSFGKTLLTRIVPEALNGSATIEPVDDGMLYTLTIGRPDFRHL